MDTNDGISNKRYDFELSINEEVDFTLNMVNEMNRQELIDYAQNFIFLQLKTEYLGSSLSSNERLYINEYFNAPVKEQHNVSTSRSFLQEIEYLTNMVKQLACILKIDQKTMNQLALDDPGAYAKTATYRRRNTPEGFSLGCYTSNLLADFLTTKKKQFNTDHNHWFMICESDQLQSPSARVSIPLNQLTTSDYFDRSEL